MNSFLVGMRAFLMLVLVLFGFGGGIAGNAEAGGAAQLLSMSKADFGRLLGGCGKARNEAAGIDGGPVPLNAGAFADRRKSESSSKVTHCWVCLGGAGATAGPKDCCLENEGGRVEL